MHVVAHARVTQCLTEEGLVLVHCVSSSLVGKRSRITLSVFERNPVKKKNKPRLYNCLNISAARKGLKSDVHGATEAANKNVVYQKYIILSYVILENSENTKRQNPLGYAMETRLMGEMYRSI